MKVALITGITGQDGSYMAERLLGEGIKVIGVVRDPVEVTREMPGELSGRIDITSWDMKDQKAISDIFERYQPSLVFNFAAISSGSGMFDDPVGISEVNGLAVARILESIRNVSPDARFCQASSSEMFGAAHESPQSESTSFRPRSPYGAAKLYAHSMVNIYRQRYGLFACSAILFNHESPRRGLEFVTRKISRGAAMIKLGLAKELQLGNLDARRDWGFAGDYVKAMHLMLVQPGAEDYVLATGKVHSVRDFCQLAFEHLDLDYLQHVRADPLDFRAAEPVQLVGDSSKARHQLQWQAEMEFSQLVRMMVDADLHSLAGRTS